MIVLHKDVLSTLDSTPLNSAFKALVDASSAMIQLNEALEDIPTEVYDLIFAGDLPFDRDLLEAAHRLMSFKDEAKSKLTAIVWQRHLTEEKSWFGCKVNVQTTDLSREGHFEDIVPLNSSWYLLLRVADHQTKLLIPVDIIKEVKRSPL